MDPLLAQPEKPVNAERGLQCDVRTLLADGGQEDRVLPLRRILLDADDDVDAALAQVTQSPAVHERVGILDRDHRAPDAAVGDQRRARPGPSGMRARLERAIERGAARTLAGVLQCDDLGMRPARLLMRAASDDHAVVIHHERTNQRIGVGVPSPTLRQRDRLAHEIRVDYHFSSKSALTYSSGENGIRSSIPSPTPT